MYYSRLDRYIGNILFHNIIIVLFILILLSSIIKFVDELRKIGQGNYGFLEAGIYVFLDILKDIELFLPIGILLGAVLGLGILSTRNELVVMEVYGFSRFQIIFSLVKAAVPLILFSIFINEWMAPMGDRIARNYRYKMIHNDESNIMYHDIWVKDGNNFVYIEKVIDFDELLGVHIYHFDEKKNLQMFCYAASAKFMKDIWDLLNVNKLYFYDFMNIVEEKRLNDIWLTSIRPNHLLMVVRSLYYSNSLSIFDIYHCIQFFKHNGQNVSQYQLYFWRKAFSPLSVIVMMLMGLSCIMKSSLYKLHMSMQFIIGVIYSFFFMY